ncbi:MAG: hypothetical protein M3R61_00610 [Chloroflexota bacterium]|nr:hypothetical protein [Chloroflexota bacterium]
MTVKLIAASDTSSLKAKKTSSATVSPGFPDTGVFSTDKNTTVPAGGIVPVGVGAASLDCAFTKVFCVATASTNPIASTVMARFRRCGRDRITGGMLLVLAKAIQVAAL